MDYTSFLPESTYIFFYQEGIHYCTAHKYSTEALINDSRLINNLLYLDSVVTHYMFRSRLSRAAYLLLKIAFFKFSLNEFVYDTGSECLYHIDVPALYSLESCFINLFCLMVLRIQPAILSSENDRFPLQLVTVRVK